MPEMNSQTPDEQIDLQDRAKKLAFEKSYLQLIINLMNKVSTAQGLDEMIETLLRNILDVIGGTDIKLYYLIDSEIYYTNLMSSHQKLDQIDDEAVQRVFVCRESVELEHDFSDTQMLTQEFTKSYTWVYPLMAGTELIGVIKLENLHIAMQQLYETLPTFFKYVASILKNEIQSQTRLKQAFDRLSKMNNELLLEVRERERTEVELCRSRDELEKRVDERTIALKNTNEQLLRELAERERVEQALRKSCSEIQDLYNHAPCGYHSLDADGVFIRINDTELQWLGYKQEEVVGLKRFTDLISERCLQVFQENFPLLKNQGWIKDLEFEMVRKDGSLLPVIISSTAITDDKGDFLMSRSTVYDNSDRKKIEESWHLLSSIVESSDDAILSKDMNEIILSWNKGAERIYGYSAEEAIGQHISLLMPPEGKDELAEIMLSLKRNERIEHLTTERIRKDGQRIFVSLTVSPIRNASGAIVSASIIARDITNQVEMSDQLKMQHLHQEELIKQRTEELIERSRELQDNQQALMNIVDDLNLKTDELEQANAKLQELDRLKSMFIASMSHELRTPLNSIIGFSSIMRDEWIGPVNSEQKENLTIINRSGKHLLSLINDVIDVSKIEAGKIEARSEEFDLYELMTEAVQYIEKDIQDKGLELSINIEHHQLFTDKRRLLQSVINLLSNAVKFTEKGFISVSAKVTDTEITDENHRSSPKQIVISVEDSGIGIAKKDLPRLFNAFVRLESPRMPTAPGTGLGLYLTKKLVVDVLGGDILCNSVEGMGSTFTLKIPESNYEKGIGSRG